MNRDEFYLGMSTVVCVRNFWSILWQRSHLNLWFLHEMLPYLECYSSRGIASCTGLESDP